MLTDTRKKMLTEFLGEKIVEHEGQFYIGLFTNGDLIPMRTFTTRNDMMDLYEKLFEMGKWNEFYCDLFNRWYATEPIPDDADANALFSAWLFCLSGDDYEKRCGMVDEFLEGGK